MVTEEAALQQATFEITQTHQALVQARHLVDELHQNVRSATHYLDDTELDAAKAQLCEPDRRERFLEAALDSLSHVEARCRSGKEVATDLVDAVENAERHLEEATKLTGVHPEGSRYLAPQVEALRDLLSVTEPVAQAALTHLTTAHDLAARATSDGINQAVPDQLHHRVVTVGHEVARADEDVRLADVAVDRVHGVASRTATLAMEINDTARSRMAAEQRSPDPAPVAGGITPGR